MADNLSLMTETESVGQLIRRSRLEKGMSLSQLAAAIGRSSSSVRRWERGEVPPAIGIVDELASVLDLEADQLRTRSADVPPSNSGLAADIDELAPARTQPQASSASGKPRGIIADIIDAFSSIDIPRVAWLRGALTTGALIVMFIIFVWAMGELWGALREVWGSFGTG